MRMSQQDMLMSMATIAAARSTCDRLHVGCVIAKEGRVISTGYNGAVAGEQHCYHAPDSDEPTGCWRAAHAEENAIAFAARYGASVMGAELLTTHQPCFNCARLIINAGIVRVVYVNPYRQIEGLKLLQRRLSPENVVRIGV